MQENHVLKSWKSLNKQRDPVSECSATLEQESVELLLE
jgi:hypothetical protein